MRLGAEVSLPPSGALEQRPSRLPIRLGHHLIQEILSGRKSATACPSYEEDDVSEGDTVRVVDKEGKLWGKIRITKIEVRRWDDFDDAVARRLGTTLEELQKMTAFANSRQIAPDEDMRITYFELVEKA